MNKHEEARNYRKQELKDLLGYIPRKDLILQYIAQAEQLEKDVKRFFELHKKWESGITLSETAEYDELAEKLSKAGDNE